MTPGNVPAKGVADLNGKKVGVVKDTTTDKALRNAIERAAVRAEMVNVPSHVDGVRMLAGARSTPTRRTRRC